MKRFLLDTSALLTLRDDEPVPIWSRHYSETPMRSVLPVS